MGKATRKLLVGGAIAAAAAGTVAVPQSASAGLLLQQKVYRAEASNAFITSRCALSINTYNLLTNKTNVGLQASTTSTVGASGGGYETYVYCYVDGPNGHDEVYSNAAGNSAYANKTIQLASGSYTLCVSGYSKIQQGGDTYVGGCSNPFTI